MEFTKSEKEIIEFALGYLHDADLSNFSKDKIESLESAMDKFGMNFTSVVDCYYMTDGSKQYQVLRNDDFLWKGNDNMNKQSLINNGYKHICTQNSKSKMELWARFNGYKDTIVYLYYIPETDMVLEQTRQTVPYTQLDMMAQIRDKMREDFLKLDVEYDKENIWQ